MVFFRNAQLSLLRFLLKPPCFRLCAHLACWKVNAADVTISGSAAGAGLGRMRPQEISWPRSRTVHTYHLRCRSKNADTGSPDT